MHSSEPIHTFLERALCSMEDEVMRTHADAASLSHALTTLTQCLAAKGAVVWDMSDRLHPRKYASAYIDAERYKDQANCFMRHGHEPFFSFCEDYLVLFCPIASAPPLLLHVIQRPVSEAITIRGYVVFLGRVGNIITRAMAQGRAQ
jgi:hypothetical protein